MTALSVIQNHCQMNALNTPSSLIGSTDTTIGQLFAVLKEILDEMVEASDHNVITLETTFVTIASEDQGALATLAPSGFQWILNETLYDRTLKRPLYGPISAEEWQSIKALPNPGPFYKYRIRGDRFLLNPVPASPFSTIAFEYASSWCVKSASGTLQSSIFADTDVFVFPERIIKKGLSYRWKQIKGLPYQADETQFYNQLNNYIARDGTGRRIDVANPSPQDIKPGIFIPTGNWDV